MFGEEGRAAAPAATHNWDAKMEKELERCTGCTSTAMIQVALRDAGGKLNEVRSDMRFGPRGVVTNICEDLPSCGFIYVIKCPCWR